MAGRAANRAREASGKATALRGVLALLVAYAGLCAGRLAIQEFRLSAEGRVLAAEQARTVRLGEELEREIGYVQTPQGIEQVAREELGLAMPGEVAIQPVKPQAPGDGEAGAGAPRHPGPGDLLAFVAHRVQQGLRL